MSKSIIKIKVLKMEKISPNMKRITFYSEKLKKFINNQVGGYVKLIFNKRNSINTVVRPYTIRNFRKIKNELDIDFSIHDKINSYASKWAFSAKKNDEIEISGPGDKKFINLNSDWLFFVGDMSSLPAISVNLEKLPANSKGHVVIEVLSDEDKQIIQSSKNIKFHWVINKFPKKNSVALINKVKTIKWPNKNPSVWVACEFNKMKKLRDFFIKEKKIDRTKIYISSYWKIGLNQEEHKIIKKKDTITWSKKG